MVLRLVLVRHGAREHGKGKTGLTRHGQLQMERLAYALRHRGTIPDHFVTSGVDHAQQSAERLAAYLPRAKPPIERLASLTPVSKKANPCRQAPSDVDTFLDELQGKIDLKRNRTIVVMGHEGRLSNLLTELTGTRERPFIAGGAVVVEADNREELLHGKGRVCYHYPTVDHHEEALKSKIQSKMTVSVFLAGFVFTSLNFLLLEAKDWPWHRITAATALTGALVLFVGAVYIFDQLGTPVGFATDGLPPRRPWRWIYRWWYGWRSRRRERRWDNLLDEAPDEIVRSSVPAAKGRDWRGAAKAAWIDDQESFARERLDGPIYWYMVRTSRVVFTPALVLALAGFGAMLAGTGSWKVQAAAGAMLVVVGIYAAARRPDLGAD